MLQVVVTNGFLVQKHKYPYVIEMVITTLIKHVKCPLNTLDLLKI